MSRGFIGFHFILLFATMRAQYDVVNCPISVDCVTPLEQIGECIPIRRCGVLLKKLMSPPLTPETRHFLKSSQCSNGNNYGWPHVCCPKDITSNDNNNRIDCRSANEPSGPSSHLNLPIDCGSDFSLETNDDSRIADLLEFPWMVLLEYTTPDGMVTACGGVLLSERYVLTAAHCVSKENLPSTWSSNTVRLGEHDTSTVRDCTEDNPTSFCADEPLTIPIEEYIIHESYRPDDRDRWYDIALLRLSRPVWFTINIKPICLPVTTEPMHELWVAGWHKTESLQTGVKMKLNISLVNAVDCSEWYRNVKVNLGLSQFCADGKPGEEFCHGDSGGPLMSFDRDLNGKRKWKVVGIVTFGSVSCGVDNWPGVYTKLIDYVPWIIGKLRP